MSEYVILASAVLFLAPWWILLVRAWWRAMSSAVGPWEEPR